MKYGQRFVSVCELCTLVLCKSRFTSSVGISYSIKSNIHEVIMNPLDEWDNLLFENTNLSAINSSRNFNLLFERIWRRNKSHFNRSQYMQKVHQYNRICMQAKSEFLKAKIRDNHHDPQKLWRVLGDVLHRLPAKMLPSINPPRLLAD